MNVKNRPRLTTVPNLLSLSRLLGVPLLFPLANREAPLLFIVWFTILGVTDFLDGKIARAWNQTSSLGSLLDSVADLAYYLSAAYFIVTLFPQYLLPNLGYFVVFFVVFGISILIPLIKFRRILFVHTYLVRMNAVFVYLLIVCSFLMDTTLFIRGILFVYYAAYAEIYALFIYFGQVDGDTRSIIPLLRKRLRG